MITEECEEGKQYKIEWLDGEYETNCTFIREHRGFLIFADEHGNKVFCRRTSMKSLTILK
mgnify:CR=1 FL=1